MTTLSLLLPLALVLAAARLGGTLSRRFGLPSVFGELTVGVLLGPAVLHLVQPNDVLRTLGDLGVLLLLFLAGLETDLVVMRSVGKGSFTAAGGGVLLQLVAGTAAGFAFGLTPFERVSLGPII